MTGIDVLIVLALLVSAGISFMRGFYREFVSLGVWVAAIFLTLAFSSNFASLLPETIESPQARLGISACLLFFGTLMIGGVATWLAMQVVSKRRKGKFDRFAGIAFGLLRGVVIVTFLVLLANLTPTIKQDSWWKNSKLIPSVQRLAKSMHKHMPDELGTHFSFSS